MKLYCEICGKELDEDEAYEGICKNCQASMLQPCDGIDMGFGLEDGCE